MKEALQGVVRHLLTTFGGVFVTSGAVTEDEWQIIIGAAGIIVGVVWSVVQKKVFG